MTKQTNNDVTLRGKIVDNFELSHTAFNKKVFTARLDVVRKSSIVDTVVLLITEDLIGSETNWADKTVKITGGLCFCSLTGADDKKHYVLAVNTQSLEEISDDSLIASGKSSDKADKENVVFLTGSIYKKPVYRHTPLGREITDVVLRVDQRDNRADIIPCILWGRNARYAGDLEVDTKIKVTGRLQSREYRKRTPNGEDKIRTTYEVSVNKMEVCDSDQGNH